jgi:hypothetical protein
MTTTKSETLEAYWSEPELAVQLDVSPKTLELWRRIGKGPPYVIARRVLYSKAAVLAWLEAGGNKKLDRRERARRRARNGLMRPF